MLEVFRDHHEAAERQIDIVAACAPQRDQSFKPASHKSRKRMNKIDRFFHSLNNNMFDFLSRFVK